MSFLIPAPADAVIPFLGSDGGEPVAVTPFFPMGFGFAIDCPIACIYHSLPGLTAVV